MSTPRLMVDECHAPIADYWPLSTAFFDLASVNVISSEYAYCTDVTLCDDEGQPILRFFQAQTAHFYYEFEVAQPIAIPSGGVERHDAVQRLVHEKNTFQYGTVAPQSIKLGTRLRFHHGIRLDFGSGEYNFSMGLGVANADLVSRYRDRAIIDQVFRHSIQELCRGMPVATFRVESDPTDQLLHHGLANLPGNCQLSTIPGATFASKVGVAVAPRRWPIMYLFKPGQ